MAKLNTDKEVLSSWNFKIIKKPAALTEVVKNEAEKDEDMDEFDDDDDSSNKKDKSSIRQKRKPAPSVSDSKRRKQQSSLSFQSPASSSVAPPNWICISCSYSNRGDQHRCSGTPSAASGETACSGKRPTR